MEEDAPAKKTNAQPPLTITAMFQALPPSKREEGLFKGGLKHGAWDEQELEVLRELQAKYVGRSEWAKKAADAWPLPQKRDRNQVHSKCKWLERQQKKQKTAAEPPTQTTESPTQVTAII